MFGGSVGGASRLALGFSGILYLSSLAGLGKVVWGEREGEGRRGRAGMLWKRHILSQPQEEGFSQCNLLCPRVFICCKYLSIFILTNKMEKMKLFLSRR